MGFPEYGMKEKIEGAIDDIRPNLHADGEDVELLDVSDNGVVRVKLLGACGGCPMPQMTLMNSGDSIHILVSFLRKIDILFPESDAASHLARV